MVRIAKRTGWGLILIALAAIFYLVLVHPDWIVAGPPKNALVLTPKVSALTQLDVSKKPVSDTSAAPTPQADTPAAAIPAAQPAPKCDTSQNVYCYGVHGVDEYGTPIPTVQVTQPAQPWIRDDGFFNYCYLLDSGNWTTVTGKLDIQPGVYYYGGDIDPASQAPAYAAESQQWCKDHAP